MPQPVAQSPDISTLLQLSFTSPPSPVPTIVVTIRNTSPDPITVLTWQSPLDPLLIQLGLANVYPPGASEPLDIPTIMVKRRMPPPEDSFSTLEPGEEASRKVEIGERFVAPEQWMGDGSGKAKVKVKGQWTAVWVGLRKQEILASKERLELLGQGEGAVTGEWEGSVEVEVEVDVKER